MPVRDHPEKFLVAFSFAGEQRELVRAIAEEVEKLLGHGTVFFDEWFEHVIAGDGADLKLQKIYGERSALAVVCISERYGGKPWTLIEHEAVRQRLFKARASADKRDRDAILPIRVGDGDVEGILITAIVPDVREKTIPQTAELIVNRLRLMVPEAGRQLGEQPPVNQIYLAESTPDMDEARFRMHAFLEGAGWSVLPTESYPENEYHRRLEADLSQCRAFVQLLGPFPWKRGGFDRIQSEAAAASKVTRYCYRSSDIDLDKVDPQHRKFLSAPDVIAAGFEDFKTHLEKKLSILALRQSQPVTGVAPPRVLVALRCENPDPVWEQVFQWIYEQQGMDHCQLRLNDSIVARFQAERFHGFLVVCDSSALNDDERSPRAALEQCREIQVKEKDANRRPPVGLVYWPPPSASWARLLRTVPLKLHRILGDQPTNLEEFFAEVRRVAQ